MPDEQGPVELRKAMEHFRTRAPEILQLWEAAVRRTLPAAWHTDELILRNHVPEFLEELAVAILTGIEFHSVAEGSDVATRVAKTLASSVISSVDHGAQRARLTDYTLGQLLHEYRILRKVAFDILDREAPQHQASREIVNDAIDRAMELAAVEFSQVQQEALALSEAQSRLVMENVHEYAIVLVDQSGTVLTWNAGAERLTGFRAEEIVGKPLADLCQKPAEAAVEEQISQATHSGWAQAEGVWTRRDGTPFWVSTVVTRVRDAPRQITGFGVVARDVTERRNREQEIRRRADELGVLNQHKDDFLAMLAHELRNPLGAVSNAIQVMEKAGPGDAAYERAKQVAKRQIQHQMRLVEDLLEASRLLRGKVQLHPERLDLTRLTRNSVEDYRSSIEEAHLSLTLDLPDGPVWTAGDPTRLSQVLGNLLQNAAKFTPPGGGVRVSLAGGERAILKVRDTGMGLSPDIQRLIFEPFAQADRSLDRSQGGLGLGLALVKGIVELHGGTVAAWSQGLGHGTEFTVSLPVVADPSQPAPVPPAPTPIERTRRVLVVEDCHDGAATLADLLELSGHVVEVASSGSEGLRKAAAFDPEVVLCDIGLPGMSGYEVAQVLRREPPPSLELIVAVTGYGGDEDRQRSHAAGFDAHLTKPVDVHELQRLISGRQRGPGG